MIIEKSSLLQVPYFLKDNTFLWLCSSVRLFKSVMEKNAFKTTRHRKMHLCQPRVYDPIYSSMQGAEWIANPSLAKMRKMALVSYSFISWVVFFFGGGGYLFVPWGYWISRWVLCLWDVHVKQTLRHTGICSVYFYILLYFAYINSINGGISFLYLKPHIYEVFTLLSNFKWMPARIEVEICWRSLVDR